MCQSDVWLNHRIRCFSDCRMVVNNCGNGFSSLKISPSACQLMWKEFRNPMHLQFFPRHFQKQFFLRHPIFHFHIILSQPRDGFLPWLGPTNAGGLEGNGDHSSFCHSRQKFSFFFVLFVPTRQCPSQSASMSLKSRCQLQISPGSARQQVGPPQLLHRVIEISRRSWKGM